MGYTHDMGEDDKPDILTLAKSISGGVTPVSGIVTSAEISDLIKPGEHGSTYGGNVLSMAVAKVAVQSLIEEGMVENSKNMGAYLLGQLKQI